ncbi:MAG TPA: methionine--tRNA ligase [bacterium]|nr:methionine--tRNA ligase [bacterium]HPL95189.1 methionine--tRNA ligase [bacterium]
MLNKFYLTTTLPYVNSEPHIGFALEIIQADTIARWQRLNDNEVFFNTGTDEHGLKIYRKAMEEGKEPQEYCDEYAAKFDNLKNALNLSYNNFIRTTDKHHLKAAQEFWQRCEKNGDIYKKNYQVKYCVGCELEKTESELENDKCPIHPNLELELINEENYFFRFSKYQQPLLDLYHKNPEFVVPAHRLTEIKNFVAAGLEDFSISRLKEKMPWGISVPGDENHVMYVWFDALINYISCLGWPEDEKKFQEFWPGCQVAGKDNLRQQSAMWQAMLMSAGLPPSKQIFIHGFITANGEKMSKSLGNVINPFELVKKFGTDAVRYYLLAKISPFEDGDYTEEKFKEAYIADLCNGLGNLVSRVSNLIEKNDIQIECHPERLAKDPASFLSSSRTRGSHGFKDDQLSKSFSEKLENYKFNEALEILWNKLRACDETVTKTEPWKIKDQDRLKEILEPIAEDILNVAILLQPFMPETAEKIKATFTAEKIKKSEPLFPRI